ncbi:MAG: exo-beta-N-acetylmuramidase NamZ domain-containing protein [Coprobacter fastidiosus]
MESGVHVVSVFAPEHGFRGNADAGEVVMNGRDKQSGLPIISLYGEKIKSRQGNSCLE